MTTTPNSWTDGYGTVHPGAPPEGYWVASDDRWYAPELHPDYVSAATASPDPEPEHTVASEKPAAHDPAAHDPAGQGSDSQGTDQYGTEYGTKQPIVREPAGPARFDVSSLESALADLETSDVSAASDWVAPVATAADARPEPSEPDPIAESSTGAPNRTLIGAVAGIVAFLGIGAGAYMALGGGDDTSVAAGESPAILANADDAADLNNGAEGDTPQVETVGTALDDDADAGDPDSQGSDPGDPASADLLGVTSCTRMDAQTLVIDLTNVSDETASYLMTVIYTDDAGNRVGDDTAYISSLRPDERTIEALYVFSDAGTGCEVIGMERYARNGTDGLADISACAVRGPGEATFLEADIEVTNSGDSDSDYTVEVALVDPDGIRYGWGTAYVERAPVAVAVAGEIYTTVPYDETYRCEVVAVTRLESP